MIKINHKLMLSVIVLPNILSGLYYFGVAAPQYQSTAQVVIETTLPQSASGQSSLTSYAPGRSKNAYTLKSALLSWAGFNAVRKAVPFKQWSSNGDFVTAYGGLLNGFTRNDMTLWSYYKHHLSLSVNKNDGVLTMEYTGYHPHQAQRILQAVLRYGKQEVRQTGQVIQASQLASAKRAVLFAQLSLEKANQNLSEYRSKNGIYDPGMFYQHALQELDGLTVKSAELQSQAAALHKSAPNSQSLIAYQQGIAALNAKIQATRAYAIANSNKSQLYPVLAANQQIAEKTLEMAKETEQKAMTTDFSPSFLVVPLSDPSAPRGASGPDRFRDSFMVLMMTLLVWSFLR